MSSQVALVVDDLPIDMVAKDHASKTALMNAAEENSVKVVRCLGELKADLNAKAKNGRTALMYAANNGYYQAVECLESVNSTPSCLPVMPEENRLRIMPTWPVCQI